MAELVNHNPWHAEPDDLDPDPRNNFTTFEFTNNNGGGRISFSTRSVRIGGPGHNVMETLDEDLAHAFDLMLTDILQPQYRAMDPPPLPNMHPVGAGFAAGIFPRTPNAQVQPGNLQE